MDRRAISLAHDARQPSRGFHSPAHHAHRESYPQLLSDSLSKNARAFDVRFRHKSLLHGQPASSTLFAQTSWEMAFLPITATMADDAYRFPRKTGTVGVYQTPQLHLGQTTPPRPRFPKISGEYSGGVLMGYCERSAVAMRVCSSHATVRLHLLQPPLFVIPTVETSVMENSARLLRLDMPGPSAANSRAGAPLSANLH